MFLKVTRAKNYHYLQVVESYRDGDKVRHRVLFSLGSLEKLKGDPQVIAILRKLIKLLDNEDVLVNEANITEEDRLNWGFLVYKKLWDRFKIGELLDEYTKDRKIRFNFKLTVFLMVITKLLFNDSKKRAYERQKKFFGIEEEIDLNSFYRALDILSEMKEKIEDELFLSRKDLFNQTIDVVYYDVTTFRFESVKSDELREFGYSKDGKPNEVQVVFGLLIDKMGRPIGYELYPGNTFEGKTLVDSLSKLKNRFKIDRVIIVADRGINNKLNLHLIKEAGYDYIFSLRLRGAEEELKEEVLKEEGYEEDEELKIKMKELPHVTKVKVLEEGKKEEKEYEDRLICTYSEERAEKDRADRERLLEKARKIVESGGSLTLKRGAKKYVKTEGREKILSIDEEKIKEDERYDGYYVFVTSDFNLSGSEIYRRYHDLWRIEDSFRVMKTTMKTRPIYHWTPRRIKGHFVMCFLAFLLERELELILKEKKVKASPEKIKENLKSIEVSKLKIDDEYYYLKGKIPDLGKKILNALRIKHLQNFFKEIPSDKII